MSNMPEELSNRELYVLRRFFGAIWHQDFKLHYASTLEAVTENYRLAKPRTIRLIRKYARHLETRRLKADPRALRGARLLKGPFFRGRDGKPEDVADIFARELACECTPYAPGQDPVQWLEWLAAELEQLTKSR